MSSLGQAILIQWLKEWDGRTAVSPVSSDTGGTPVPPCLCRPESLRRSRPEHAFTALNTNETLGPPFRGETRARFHELFQAASGPMVANAALPGHFALAHTLASESEGSRGEPGPAMKHAEKMV
jgi:hypothetical protein